MAGVTSQQRIQRIDELLRELNKMPPEKHETARLPGPADEPMICDVITIGAEEVLLNHRSHRVRSQLQDDPEWHGVEGDPTSEAAQRIVERHVRASRTDDAFKALKESLLAEGQEEAGVLTHDGVLINANTRAVAIREFEDPFRRYIRVAVLPPTIQPDQLAILELRLQMQKDLKAPYSLTNELLFIEELSNERQISNAQIAKELRISPENPKKGAAEIHERLLLLDLLRQMQRLPDNPLPLKFFDAISLQHLRDVRSKYQPLFEKDPEAAQRYLQSYLLSIAVDVIPVHQVRKIDADFMGTYMVPQLEEDEQFGPFALQLVASPDKPGGAPEGAQKLLGDTRGHDEDPSIDVGRLLNLVSSKNNSVKVPGTDFTFQREEIKSALKTAVITGIKEKDRIGRAQNKLETPLQSVRTAASELTKARDGVVTLAADPSFTAQHHKSLEAAFKTMVRKSRALEETLKKNKIIGS
jgi:hypothetical protein